MGRIWVLQGFLFKCLSSKYLVPNLSVWQYPSEASFPVNPKYDNAMAERSKDKKLFLYHSEPEKTKRQKKRQKDIETKRHKYRKIDKRHKRKKEI